MILAPASPVLANEPHIGYVYPAGARAGASVEVTVGGQFLDSPTGLRASGGGVQAEVAGYFKELTRQELNGLRNRLDRFTQTVGTLEGQAKEDMEAQIETVRQTFMEQGFDRTGRRPFQRPDPKKQPNLQLREQVTLRLTLEADAGPGVREIRLLTQRGLSNPLAFHVSALPEWMEIEPNDLGPADDLSITLPAVLNGRILPGDVDRFLIPARKGQRLTFKTEARSLMPYLADAVPGWFQATLTLYDPRGNEAAYVDDHRFDPDPALVFNVPEDGDYILEITDSLYRGREDFVYRIAVGEFPLTPMDPQALPPIPEGFSTVSEKESNDTFAASQPVALPVAIAGSVGRPGDWDVFRFKGSAGETLVAEVLARRWGSPLDSILKLTDGAGTVLQVNDDEVDRGAGLTTHHADSRLVFTLPADGAYALHLGDVQGQGGPEHGYVLRIGPPHPGFDLRVTPASVNVPGGGSTAITVHALRRDGFDGDIELSLRDAPAGFSLSGNRISAGADKARITLRAPRRTETSEWTLALEGTATIGGRPVRRQAVPAEDMMQAFLWRHLVPARDWAVAVTRPRPGIEVRAPEGGVVRIPAGGQADIVLRNLQARGRAAGPPLRFELDEPVEGLTMAKSSARAGQGEAVVAVRADPERLQPGTRGYIIFNGLPANGRRNVILCTSPAIPFEIVKESLPAQMSEEPGS